MKERPILFSAPMVRAILEGRKTVTRRIVREALDYPVGFGAEIDWASMDRMVRCPYGAPGDRLWVRETWGAVDDRECPWPRGTPVDPENAQVTYRAHGSANVTVSGIWRPSIHMPRWASRITLGVVSVRVERLHEITEQDAIREGVSEIGFPRDSFRDLWDTINGRRAPWASNPWVWRVAFERLA